LSTKEKKKHKKNTSLIELEQEPIARKVHIHVKTKLHGGPGSDNLLRVEDRFDHLHDKVVSKLNRLMSRIKRHPAQISPEHKEHPYAFESA